MVRGHEPSDPLMMGARVYTQDRIPLGRVEVIPDEGYRRVVRRRKSEEGSADVAGADVR